MDPSTDPPRDPSFMCTGQCPCHNAPPLLFLSAPTLPLLTLVVAFALLGLAFVCIGGQLAGDKAFAKKCHLAGGQVHPAESRICVSEDGRIITITITD